MSDVITAVEVVETEFGEKVVLDSPFEAKEYINALPWQSLEDEVSEHGSLREKLEDRGVAQEAIDAAEEFGFSDDFAAHSSWNPTALGADTGGWLIDRETFSEAADFFEYAGFSVDVEDGVEA